MTSFRQRFVSAAAIVVVALGAFAGASSASAQSGGSGARSSEWRANEDDALLLQLQIGNYQLTNDVRGYKTDRGVCLDFADVVQSLDLPIRIDKESRRATGWLFAEDQEITIDRASGTVQNVNTGQVPLAKDIYDTPEGWCVDTDALSRWFGIDFKPDLFNAAVRLDSDTELPFMQAIQRRKRAERIRPRTASFDLSQYPSSRTEYRSWRTPSLDVVANVEARSGGGTAGRVEFLAAGEALGASYTARISTDNAFNPQTLRFRAYRKSPDGDLLGPLGATDVAIGDVETVPGRLVGQTAVGRGAFITNRPLGQTSRFSTTVLRGTLPAGWDAELYRNGQLIAFQQSREDGRYEFFDIELYFGRNDFEVVLYGPQGQVRREQSSVPVGVNQIEPGKTYYWAGVLQDNRDLIQLQRPLGQLPQEWRWGAGVERGLTQRTSVGLGVHDLFLNGARRTYTEATVTHSLSFAQLELAAAHEFGGGTVAQLNSLGRVGNFNFGTNTQVFFGNFSGEFAENDLAYRAGVNFSTSLRMGRLSLPLQGAFSHAKRSNGEQINDISITSSITAGRMSFSAQLKHEKDTGRPEYARTEVILLANARFRDFRVRGNATFRASRPDQGLESATVRVDTDFGEDASLQGELEYSAGTDEFRLSAGYTHRFEQFSLRGDAFVTSRGDVGVGLQLAFSLGPDPVSGGVRVSNNKLARNGQAAVTVYRDDNGNNRRDADEPLLENVMVEAGLRSAEAITGANGRAIVDELRPFQPVLVGIDESSLDDPFLAPTSKGIVITPRPGVVAQIELPISPTGEVEGSLLSSSGVEQPGVKLELIDRRGAIVAETISEFDGFFLFQRVPYGEYRLRVAQDAAAALQVASALKLSDGSSSFTLGMGSDVVRYGTIRLVHERTPQEPRDEAPVIAAIKPE